jgi:hydrogenase nickel incorporation protein HypA/HybF
MHEWALAEAVIAAASETAEREGLKHVTRVTVRVGELQQVERATLEFALSQLKTARFKRAKFDVETEKARLRCRVCGHTWVFRQKNVDRTTLEAIHFVPEIAHAYVKCPNCASPDFEIEQGRGVWLQTVRGVK